MMPRAAGTHVTQKPGFAWNSIGDFAFPLTLLFET